MNETHYDVLVSFSPADQAWVSEVLMPRLEEAGVKVLLDARESTPEPLRPRADRLGWVNCRKTLLILTPHYLETVWPEVEDALLETLDPASFQPRLLPLLKTESALPPRLDSLAVLDFTDHSDPEVAGRQLLVALGKPPAPPALLPRPRDLWCLSHPYAMAPHFTGRQQEHLRLTEWLRGDPAHPLLVLRALGGFGKSALTWHWLMEEVDPGTWPRVIWWSFYETDASFESFLAHALKYLSDGLLDPRTIPFREQVSKVLRALEQTGTLLVLDGFERALRAFGGLNPAHQDEADFSALSGLDCRSLFAEDFLHRITSQRGIFGKVLLTTRHTPRVLAQAQCASGTRWQEVELAELQPADAVAFFQVQGIRGRRAELEATAAAFGYHPLTLRLLAGSIVGDCQQPGDIASVQHLDQSGALEQRQLRVLEHSDRSLTPERQNLLRSIACFRGPVDHEALKAVAQSVGALASDLGDLEARGLLQHDLQTNRFDLHPMVRRYAYHQWSLAERAVAHGQLRDYFSTFPRRKMVRTVDDLSSVIEWYHHTVRAGQYDEAQALYSSRLAGCISYQFGAYQLEIDLLRALFPDGEDHSPRLSDENAQAWTLNSLANSYRLSGQPQRAAPLFERVNPTLERSRNRGNLAISLGNLADDQIKIGALRAAESNLLRSIGICREIGNELQEATGQQELGRLLAYRGDWAGSDAALSTALRMAVEQNQVQLQGVVWAHRALRELLKQRHFSRPPCTGSGNLSALAAARRALELADETTTAAHFVYPARDYMRAHWLLGASYRLAGQIDDAGRHLHEALEHCRRQNSVEAEAEILIELARLRTDTDDRDEARQLAGDALLITERSRYALLGADAHLVLARVEFTEGNQDLARRHAAAAERLAACDGPPDYSYQAAHAEAGQWLRALHRPERVPVPA